MSDSTNGGLPFEQGSILLAGEKLLPGESRQTPTGNTVLKLHKDDEFDGILRLYRGDSPDNLQFIWSPNVDGQKSSSFVLEDNACLCTFGAEDPDSKTWHNHVHYSEEDLKGKPLFLALHDGPLHPLQVFSADTSLYVQGPKCFSKIEVINKGKHACYPAFSYKNENSSRTVVECENDVVDQVAKAPNNQKTFNYNDLKTAKKVKVNGSACPSGIIHIGLGWKDKSTTTTTNIKYGWLEDDYIYADKSATISIIHEGGKVRKS